MCFLFLLYQLSITANTFDTFLDISLKKATFLFLLCRKRGLFIFLIFMKYLYKVNICSLNCPRNKVKHEQSLADINKNTLDL